MLARSRPKLAASVRHALIRRRPFLGEVLLELAADALELSGASREQPLDYEGIRERYLPEFEFRGKTHDRRSHYALGAGCHDPRRRQARSSRRGHVVGHE